MLLLLSKQYYENYTILHARQFCISQFSYQPTTGQRTTNAQGTV